MVSRPSRFRHSMPRSRRLIARSSLAPSAGEATGKPARITRASEARSRKVSCSSLVTCTLIGVWVCFMLSKMAALTCSRLLPFWMYSAGSISKSLQRERISVTRLRSASAPLRCPPIGAAGDDAGWGRTPAGVSAGGWMAGGAAMAPAPPESPLSWASISASACSISRWKLSNSACSSVVSERFPSALAAFTMACCFKRAASRLCFGVICLPPDSCSG